LKKIPEVLAYLKEEKIQPYEHDWEPEEWNIRAV
jgi:hypothetical protein